MKTLHLIRMGFGCLTGMAFGGMIMGAELSTTFAERLGWEPGAVVVILHVDDVGMSHSSNAGAIRSVEHGVASSWAVMMPCPWVSEIAGYLREHPEIDSGLHLTMNAEWDRYRWGPLAGSRSVPGLTDPEGCLWGNVREVVENASPDEVEIEIRAQIERAERMGLPITHLDSHMGALFAHPAFFQRYVKVGIEKQIPILVTGGHMTHVKRSNPDAVEQLAEYIPQIWNAGLPVIDDLHTDTYGWPPAEKTERLVRLLESLEPGITEILFHASDPSDVFPLITGSSESRRADTDALTSPEVRRTIEERGIVVTTWRELMLRRQAVRVKL